MDNLKQIYNDISGHYERVRPLWPEMAVWLKDLKDKDLVLDVGCGEGRLLQELGLKVNYTGVDFSNKLLAVAKERYQGKNYKFITGDITKEDTWKNIGRFNKIYCVAVIHHLKNSKEQLYVLKKIRKHLNPGGKGYVSFWNLWQRKFWSEHIKSIPWKLIKLPESLMWVKIPFRNTKLKRLYFAGSRRYWKRLLTQAGWKNIRLKSDKKNIWAVLG